MKIKSLFCLVGLSLTACQAPSDVEPAAETSEPVLVPVVSSTTPTRSDGANDVAIWSSAGASLIIGTDTGSGLEVYSLDGTRVAELSDRATTLLDVYNGGEIGDGLVVAFDEATTELVVYSIDASGPALHDVTVDPPTMEEEMEGLCLYRSPLSEKLYTYAIGGGIAFQYELVAENNQVQFLPVREVPLGLGATHCAANHQTAEIYISYEGLGVFRLAAEPESEAAKALFAPVEPYGVFAGDIKGIAVRGSGANAQLIVSDADESRLQVFDLASGEHAGTVTIDGVEETEGLAVTRDLLVVADDDNGDEHTNYKMVEWSALASAIGLTDTGVATAGSEEFVVVKPAVETAPVASFGDAADDPAIWVHPTAPELSVIIGTQKQRGINVYDLEGNLLQSRPDGRVNNVDLRYDFPLGGENVAIVAGSNRTYDSVSVWAVDPYRRVLDDVAAEVIDTGMDDPYGSCMYRSASTGDYYVYINDTDGLVRQWRLQDDGTGKVAAEQVRDFHVGSQTEGCVADDETGILYIGEENVGIWRYSAEPDGGDERVFIDGVDGNGNLTSDVEGLAIYYGPDGGGYLVASNQGDDSYALYERAGDNAFIGIFHVVANEQNGIDGISETDGLDVTSAALGPDFPDGVFVAQDGRNISPRENQNFKLVSWTEIAEAMQLD